MTQGLPTAEALTARPEPTVVVDAATAATISNAGANAVTQYTSAVVTALDKISVVAAKPPTIVLYSVAILLLVFAFASKVEVAGQRAGQLLPEEFIAVLLFSAGLFGAATAVRFYFLRANFLLKAAVIRQQGGITDDAMKLTAAALGNARAAGELANESMQTTLKGLDDLPV